MRVRTLSNAAMKRNACMRLRTLGSAAINLVHARGNAATSAKQHGHAINECYVAAMPQTIDLSARGIAAYRACTMNVT